MCFPILCSIAVGPGSNVASRENRLGKLRKTSHSDTTKTAGTTESDQRSSSSTVTSRNACYQRRPCTEHRTFYGGIGAFPEVISSLSSIDYTFFQTRRNLWMAVLPLAIVSKDRCIYGSTAAPSISFLISISFLSASNLARSTHFLPHRSLIYLLVSNDPSG